MVDLTVVGEREESVNDLLAVIGTFFRPYVPQLACSDGIHAKPRRIHRAVRAWLANTCKGAERARLIELGVCLPVYRHLETHKNLAEI